jgi:hypothetical protein
MPLWLEATVYYSIVASCSERLKFPSRLFLWLVLGRLSKEDALNNPFGPGTYKGDNTDGIPMHVPEFKYLTEAQGDAENIDPADEITFGEEKQRERKRILEEEDARTTGSDGVLSNVGSAAGHPLLIQPRRRQSRHTKLGVEF